MCRYLQVVEMYGINPVNFRQEIKTFKETIAPTDNQWNYLNGKKGDIEMEIKKTARSSHQSQERCLLVAICGELTDKSSKQQQAEFATRLLLLDLLME